VTVGLCLNVIPFHIKSVIIFGTAQGSRRKTVAELHALNRGNSEKRRRNAVLYPVKNRLSKTRGNADYAALNNSADGITVFFSRFNRGAHPLSGLRIQNGKLRLLQGAYFGFADIHRIKRLRLNIGDLYDVRRNLYSFELQQLQTNAAGDAKGSGKPPGKFAAPAMIPRGTVFDKRRIIRVAWAGDIL